MSLVVISEPVPLVTDADGVVRVSKSRVTLDTLVAAFRDGMTPEGIAEQYPSLLLADIYSVIGYILAHPDDVDTYLQARHRAAAQVRKANEARFDPQGVRSRLLSRRQQG